VLTIPTLHTDGVARAIKVTDQTAAVQEEKRRREMDGWTCNQFAPAHSILVKGVHMHKTFDSRMDQAWWALRIGLGVGPFLAGLDKYFNLLTNWPGYISPLVQKILPFSGQTFMHIVGVIEIHRIPLTSVSHSRCSGERPHLAEHRVDQ
jgi:hypothetical protein